MTEQCSKMVQPAETWIPYRCSRKGKVQVDGKWYCKQHDPVEVKRREQAREEKWRKEDQKHKHQEDIQDARDEVANVAMRWFEDATAEKELLVACAKLKELLDADQ